MHFAIKKLKDEVSVHGWSLINDDGRYLSQFTKNLKLVKCNNISKNKLLLAFYKVKTRQGIVISVNELNAVVVDCIELIQVIKRL